MNNKKENNMVVGWILLILLIFMALGVSYVNFFVGVDKKIEEKSVDNNESEAINNALTQIVNYFNDSDKIDALDGVNIHAVLNNRSIFISYITDITTTYEFTYDNLALEITVSDDEDNLKKFHQVCEILIYAIQMRLNNGDNIEKSISSFINDNVHFKGLEKTILEEHRILYHFSIVTKLENNFTSDDSLNVNENASIENNN